MSPSLLDEIFKWPEARKEDEIQYIARSIPSSHEFIDFIFLIEDVTRGFTHQFVRNRHMSFAQQTMRVLNVRGWSHGIGPSIIEVPARAKIFMETMNVIAKNYDELVKMGAEIEDARGILPTDIHTNILVKANLRTLSELFSKRGNLRTQGEYRAVLGALREATLRGAPWAEPFVTPKKHTVAERLKQIAANVLPVRRDVANEILKEAEILERELGI